MSNIKANLSHSLAISIDREAFHVLDIHHLINAILLVCRWSHGEKIASGNQLRRSQSLVRSASIVNTIRVTSFEVRIPVNPGFWNASLQKSDAPSNDSLADIACLKIIDHDRIVTSCAGASRLGFTQHDCLHRFGNGVNQGIAAYVSKATDSRIDASHAVCELYVLEDDSKAMGEQDSCGCASKSDRLHAILLVVHVDTNCPALKIQVSHICARSTFWRGYASMLRRGWHFEEHIGQLGGLRDSPIHK